MLDGALPNPVMGVFGRGSAPRLDQSLESDRNRVRIVFVTDGDEANRNGGEGFALQFQEGQSQIMERHYSWSRCFLSFFGSGKIFYGNLRGLA